MSSHRQTFQTDASTSMIQLIDVEGSFDHDSFLAWMNANWTVVFWISAVYLSAVAVGRRYMSNRPAFKLQLPLVIWNISLAVFSVLGAYRTLPEVFDVLFFRRGAGWQLSVCDVSFYTERPTSFWAAAFVLSKVVELGDTAFVVLRRQPLITLHWWHHTTVMIYVWYSYVDRPGPGRWFMAINFLIHSFMYTYYAVRAMKFRLPVLVSMCVTMAQIVQMVVGLVVTWSSFRIRTLDGGSQKDVTTECQHSYENIAYAALMYASYLVLFGQFFYISYVAKNKSKSWSTSTTNGASCSVSCSSGQTTANNNHLSKKSE